MNPPAPPAAAAADSQRRLWDISPPVDEDAPVYPTDARYRQRWTSTLAGDCPVNVSEISLSPHTGAHADAPLHYRADGAAVGLLDLAPYLGPCVVLHIIERAPLVGVGQVRDALARLALPVPERLLVRTALRASQAWDNSFAAYAADTIDWLAERGCRLVGIDTPSIDPADSKALPAHQAVARHDLRVLENLVLDAVPEGRYELIALPLKLTRCDASPVRAVLRALPN
jgi:arylformamidase